MPRFRRVVPWLPALYHEILDVASVTDGKLKLHRFIRQLFGSFTEMCLDFQILLEIVFAEFIVQFQKVIEFLNIQLVVFPKLVDLSLRNEFNFVPLLL